MAGQLRDKMTFHGAVVVLLGLLAGLPYGLVVLGSLAGSERAWRMAHMEGVLNGLLVIAVAAASNRLALSSRSQAVLAWSLILMAYGNVIAAGIGATFGVRGLAPGGSVSNTIVYLLFMLAIVGVVLGLGLVVYGARAGAARPGGLEESRTTRP
jgi:hypothetical protein